MSCYNTSRPLFEQSRCHPRFVRRASAQLLPRAEAALSVLCRRSGQSEELCLGLIDQFTFIVLSLCLCQFVVSSLGIHSFPSVSCLVISSIFKYIYVGPLAYSLRLPTRSLCSSYKRWSLPIVFCLLLNSLRSLIDGLAGLGNPLANIQVCDRNGDVVNHALLTSPPVNRLFH